ncbi:hypothetical protein DSO57_1011863 [Entomophthora muscae]|uniref:Uncharacterized protein n=1 Tax=Entomophthora muscae TaxID=34485 RepID=A0ACC2S8I1_9FUNG|nr:hypothetical protein DSO57_1011863 [Entomophthora muscae]
MKASALLVAFVVGQSRLESKVETNLIQPSINMVNRTAFYAAAASCSVSNVQAWSCRSCRKARKTKPTGVLAFTSPSTTAMGYTLADVPNKMIILSFRGTNNFNLGATDLKYTLVPFKDMKDPNVKVHQGFLEVLDSLYPEFMPYLKKYWEPDYSIVVTGVSLGGAVASLAAVRIHTQLRIPFKRLTLITFGQPRTGNEAYARAYNRMPMRAARVVNYDDPFPHTPPSNIQGYTHHQNELYLKANGDPQYCNQNVLEDPKCANKLSGLYYDPASHLRAFDAYFNPLFGC